MRKHSAVDCEFVINPEQAEIVKIIYGKFHKRVLLQGHHREAGGDGRQISEGQGCVE